MQKRSFDVYGSPALNLSEKRVVPYHMPQASLTPLNHILHSGSLQHLLLCHASDWEEAVLSGSQLCVLIIGTNL